MPMMWRRYVQSTGYAPSWFYIVVGLGFLALTVWAIAARDWVVAIIAVVMIVAAAAAVPITRALSRALASSERAHRPD